ncbi:hypothetical protein Q5752_004809 [Cryptotrichosporon argae]
MDLGSIGAQLDAARRARHTKAGTEIEHVEDVSRVDDFESVLDFEHVECAAAEGEGKTEPCARPTRVPEPNVAPPAPAQDRPLCLLCLVRAPCAVLLPCCHLVLCELCAPRLLRPPRGRDDDDDHPPPTLPTLTSAAPTPASAAPPASPPTSAPPVSPVLPQTRTPYAVALARALATSPRARRLALGGYLPPARGGAGAEWRGEDVFRLLCPDASRRDRDGPATGGARTGGERQERQERAKDGLDAHTDDDARLRPSLHGKEAGRCLVCRAGVGAWLRVYT